MARIIDNQISGKLGDKVYYRRNGKCFVRLAGKQRESNTYKQLVHRAKIRAVTQFLSYFSKIINIGYQGGRERSMEFNESISYHFRNALKEFSPTPEEGPKFEIDINKVVLSRGNIAKPEILNCARDGRQITLTWNNTLGAKTNRHNDVVVLVAYIAGKKAAADFNIGTRKEGKGTMLLPAEFNKPVHLWAFYHNAQRSSEPGKEYVSDSVYLGER